MAVLETRLSADNLQAYFLPPCDANENVFRGLSLDQVGAKHLIRVESPEGCMEMATPSNKSLLRNCINCRKRKYIFNSL